MQSAFEAFHLHPEVLQGLASRDVHTPTPLQRDVIPLLMDGRDLVVHAEPGAGTALALLLPLFSLIDPEGRPQAVVMVPSGARAKAIAETARHLCPAPWRIAALGAGRVRSEDLASDVLVGTPSALLDLVDRHPTLLEAVRLTALVAADEVAEDDQLVEAAELLAGMSDREQAVVFTTSLPRDLEAFIKSHLKSPARLAPQARPAAVGAHHVVCLPRERLREGVLTLLTQEAPDRALLFTRSRWDGKRLAERIEKSTGAPTGALGGHLSAGARRALVERFQAGELRYLIVADGLARGLDFGCPPAVIHLDVPASELYMERSAHVGPDGRIWLLSDPEALTDVAAIRQVVELTEMKLELEQAEVAVPPAARPAEAPKPARCPARTAERPAPERAPRAERPARAAEPPAQAPERPARAPARPARAATPPAARRPVEAPVLMESEALAPPPPERRGRGRGGAGPVNADTGRFLNDMAPAAAPPTTGSLVPLPRHMTSWRQFRLELAPGHRQTRDSFHGWLAQTAGIPRSTLRSIVIQPDHATVEVEAKSVDRFLATFGGASEA
ncbi:MAG: DEAD/DEAH box helicase [Candidatus Sericytochromatia bacterium]